MQPVQQPGDFIGNAVTALGNGRNWALFYMVYEWTNGLSSRSEACQPNLCKAFEAKVQTKASDEMFPVPWRNDLKTPGNLCCATSSRGIH